MQWKYKHTCCHGESENNSKFLYCSLFRVSSQTQTVQLFKCVFFIPVFASAMRKI